MSARPKRKATNRAYNEVLDESIFEELKVKPPAVANGSATPSKKRGSGTNSSSKDTTPSVDTPPSSASNPASDKPEVPYNWQPLAGPGDYFSNKLNLKAAFIDLKTQTLYCPNQPMLHQPSGGVASNGNKRRKTSKECFKICKNDFIYMVSEPPGEPYYIGSIMGFSPKEVNRGHNTAKTLDSSSAGAAEAAAIVNGEDGDLYEDAANYVFKIQWFYRPRDISKSTSDSRLLYASMHSDTCPLLSFRGMVTVKHKGDIESGLVPIPQNPYTPTGSGGKDASVVNSKSSTPTPLPLLEAYSQVNNCFYFDKLFDRYMIKFYDIILTKGLLFQTQLKNIDKNQNFLKALNKRFEYIFVEGTMAKAFVNSFASSSCNCEKCGQWCSNQDSVNCVVCNNFYHMYCLDPPLLKKPSRGFSWSCAPCTKKHDLEHQKKKMIMLSHDNKLSNELQLTNELSSIVDVHTSDSGSNSANNTDSPEDGMDVDDLDPDVDSEGTPVVNGLPKFESMAIEFLEKDSHITLEERRIKEEWNMRYLGMHARLEDGVDLDDRSPYPRALTRLGAKHQALNLPEYEGHNLVYYDTEKTLNPDYNNGNTKRKSSKKSQLRLKKSNSANAEEGDPAIVKMEIPKEFKDVDPDEYPEWLQPRPKGYIERGVDDGEGRTCTLLYKPAEEDIEDNFEKLDNYVERCYPIAETKLGLIPTTPNFMDAILNTYMINKGDIEKSLEVVNTFTRASLSEPTLTKEEIKKFEDGVRKYGSELFPTFKEVKTQPCSMIVRFYYLWKKTANGRAIWGNFEGRLQKKVQNIKDEEIKQQQVHKQQKAEIDNLACLEDDSCYESSRIELNKKLMTCKHCLTNQSIFWHRITGFDANTEVLKSSSIDEKIDKKSTVALCFRCAKLWRRYAVLWEDPQEVKKKNTRGAGGWKKKVEYELVLDSENILKESERLGGLAYTVPKVATSVLEAPPLLAVSIPKVTKKTTAKPNTNGNRKSSASISVVSTPTHANVKVEPKKKLVGKLELNVKKEATAASVPGTTASTSTTATPVKVRGKPGPKPKNRDGSVASKKPVVKAVKKEKIAQNSIDIKSVEAKEPVKRKRELIPKSERKKPGPKPKVKIIPADKPVPEFAPIVTKPSVESKPIDSGPPLKKPRKGAAIKTSTDRGSSSSGEISNFLDPSKLNGGDESIGKSNGGIINPNYNKNYRMPILKNKGDKKATTMTKELLENTITQFRPRQLLEVGSQLPIYQVSSGTIIDIPFSATDRNCSFCQENDLDELSLLEMLICSNCGVNVHASCVGLTVPSLVEKPVKEWLCEPCVNDLNPHHSTLYSCSLCLANESNYELTMLGSDKVKPDYLKPISDSGKWCHLLCAILNHDSINFKSILKRSYKWGSDYNATNVANQCSIESVSEIYLKSYDSKCGICNSGNGSLVKCDLCPENEASLYHPTCAQDTNKFTVGLKVDTTTSPVRDLKLVNVDGVVGRLKPVIVCSRHDVDSRKRENVVSFRSKGFKIHVGGDPKPLIQLLMEDIAKNIDQSYKLSGPQAMASNYIKLSTMFEESERKRQETTYYRVLHKGNKVETGNHKCKRCEVTVSPMWWSIRGKGRDDSGDRDLELDMEKTVHCQSCHHEVEDRDLEERSISPPPIQSESLIEIINKPLNGETFGLKNNNDRILA